MRKLASSQGSIALCNRSQVRANPILTNIDMPSDVQMLRPRRERLELPTGRK